MRCLRVLVGLALASCGGTTSSAPGGVAATPVRLTAKDIVQRSSPAIVVIEAGSEKIGTGFIVDKSGIVATNLHVVAGEAKIKIHLFDHSQYQVVQISGIDQVRDLALLRIQPTRELPVLKLGDSD